MPMSQFLKSRLFVASIFFLLGFGVGRLWSFRPLIQFAFHRETGPFAARDPMDDFRRLQNQFLEQIPKGGFNLDLSELQFKDEGKAYVLEIRLDGMQAKNFNVQTNAGQLSIDGTLSSPDGQMTSQFSRSVPIPEDVDADGIQMETKGDHLRVTLPKK